MRSTHVDLPGNSRPPKIGATRIGPAELADTVEITVVLRGMKDLPEPNPSAAPVPIGQLEQTYGADPSDVSLVKSTLEQYGLSVTEEAPGARTVDFTGTVAQMQLAFSVQLGKYHSAQQGEYRGREGDVKIPSQLAGIVVAVLGLDERKVAKRHRAATTVGSPATGGAQIPSDIETRYNFPDGTADGQSIGILEFSGGYWESDLQQYCSQIASRPQPNVTVVPVGLQSLSLAQIQAITNQDERNEELDASGEVNMDVQIVAGLCPGASISVYFAPFTQRGWLKVIGTAVHDPNGPKSISVSWGNPEDTGDFTTAAITAINNVLKMAATAGVTVCVSSGDDGAGDAVNDGQAHCDFPASSPYVLAVGGTMFPGGEAEQGWWDTPGARTQNNGGGSSGGGRSTVFPTPSWQNIDVVSVRTGRAEGRCIPDVCALSGAPLYNLIFDGQVSPNGGTSASAPLWASLLARIASNLPTGTQLGFVTPKLYAIGTDGQPVGASVCTDVTVGHNDVVAYEDDTMTPPQIFKPVTGYQATAGFDAVSGWGTPIGTELLNAFSAG